MPRQDNINLKSDEEIALYKAASQRQQAQQQQQASTQVQADWKNPEYVKGMIVRIGKEQGLSDAEIQFALAIAAKESGFNVNAHNKGTKQNPENSWGVFQINTNAHPDYTGGLDPVSNIAYGTKFAAAKYRQAKGDPKLAARMYNGSGQMAENYSRDFIANYYPKYSTDYSSGKIATIDPSQPIAQAPLEQTTQKEIDRISDNYQRALQDARKAYDWSNARTAMEAYANQYNTVRNSLISQFPMATQEQIDNAANQYMEQIGFTRDFVNQQIATLQDASKRENIVDPAVAAYNQQSMELQNQLAEANPYTRLAQMAPIQDLQPIDIEKLKATQAADKFGTSFYAMQNPQVGRPDYSAMQLQQAQQLEQAARYNQAVEQARITGLPLDYFLTGAGMDYNALGTLGQNRLANQQAMENAYISNVVPNLNRDIASMTNTANTVGAQLAQEGRLAQQNLINANIEQLKQQYELARSGLGQVGGLLNTALTGANQQGVANTNVVPSIYATSEGNLTSRLNTMESNQRALEQAYLNQQAQNQPTINPITGANSLITAGTYGNNPALINTGAATTLGALGYDPQAIQAILGQGSGTVNVPQAGGLGFIPPQMFNQQQTR